MPASIGVNLRVTGHCRQGGRKYMEDFFSVAYQQTEDEKDLEYAFFGIYDGHGGAEAAAFAKEHLMETIIKHKNFWSDDDDDVLRAIKDGYIATHHAMWREQEKWPRTTSGLPSTAGTTASIAFIRRGKIYIGHVGDSGIILGYQEPGCSEWKAKPLTRDHKPENAEEMSRIKSCGGKVVSKSGVPRVVWNRPKIGHQGPVRRSTPIDEIPFLAVARSLGDLWSYNYQSDKFIVSPDPDCTVIKIETNTHRCLIFGTDGLYNMLSPHMAVHIVQQVERHNENAALSDSTYKTWLNPSKLLVEKALERWHSTKMRADNTSVVTLMLDPPGPPRAQVLKDRKKNLPERGLKIMTRFDRDSSEDSTCGTQCDSTPLENPLERTVSQNTSESLPEPTPVLVTTFGDNTNKEEKKNECLSTASTETTSVSSSDLTTNSFPLKERNFVPKLRESTSFDPRETWDSGKENFKTQNVEDNNIQCNEVSSSNIEVDDESVETVRNGRHNLRSGKREKREGNTPKVKNSDDETKSKSIKRKLELSQNCPVPRKSRRLDMNKKKADEPVVENPRRAFEAEEKLKRLAEKADLAKRRSTSIEPTPSSSAQTIPKFKIKDKEVKNKSDILNKPIAKKKLKLVLDRVKLVQESVVFKRKAEKSRKSENSEKNQVKIVAKGATFQRHLKSHISLRQRNVTVVASVIHNKSAGKLKPKLKIAKNHKKKKLGVEKKNVTSVKVVNAKNKRSSKSSLQEKTDSSRTDGTSNKPIHKSNSIKRQPKPVVKIKAKAVRKTNKIKKKIQQKTASLKRNVLRKK